jgi:hypothetical protein
VNVLSNDKKQQVLARGRLGWTLRDIEEAVDVRRETASRYLKAVGIAGRGPTPLERTGASTRLGGRGRVKTGQPRERGVHRLRDRGRDRADQHGDRGVLHRFGGRGRTKPAGPEDGDKVKTVLHRCPAAASTCRHCICWRGRGQANVHLCLIAVARWRVLDRPTASRNLCSGDRAGEAIRENWR